MAASDDLLAGPPETLLPDDPAPREALAAGADPGPIPWEHEGNRGFLRALHALGQAAAASGEPDEAERCAQFLADSSPTAARELQT